MASPVLADALEVHTAGAGDNNNDTSAKTTAASSSNGAVATIPMDGVSKEEWLEVAALVYPVVPPAKIANLGHAEKLRVAVKYDIELLLHKVDRYVKVAAKNMTSSQGSPRSIWKFIQLADEASLVQCIPALTERAVDMDMQSCASLNFKLEAPGEAVALNPSAPHLPGESKLGNGSGGWPSCRNCGSGHMGWAWQGSWLASLTFLSAASAAERICQGGS